jgi:hypothetical protein
VLPSSRDRKTDDEHRGKNSIAPANTIFRS